MSKQVEFITYVENNDIEKVKEYLLKIDAKHNDSEALNSACVNGNEKMVEILLPRSDANAKNGFALKNAAYYGHVNIAKMLCDKVDFEYVGDAMCVAAARGNLDVLRAINTNRAKDMNDALIWAVTHDGEGDNYETLRYLNRNANPNSYNAEAMVSAISHNNKKAIDLFFDRVDVRLVRGRIARENIEGEGVAYFKDKVEAYENVNDDIGNSIIENIKNKTKNSAVVSNKKNINF